MTATLQATVEQLLDVLQATDLAAVADTELLEQITLLHRTMNRLDAALSARIATAHVRGSASAQGHLTTGVFVRHSCQLTPSQARARVDADTELTDHPDVAAAYAAGALPNGHVQQILATLRALPDDMRSDATRVLLRVGEAHDSTRLAQAARRLKMIADPDGHLAAQLRRDADRWLDIHPLLDGMAAINGLIPMQTAAALRTALDALDQPQPDELRTATQRRADNLGQLLMLCLDADRLPINGGHRPHLTVTVDLASLQIQPYAAPGELDFGESLHPETARRLACDALITRILTTRQPDADTQPSLPAGLARLYEQLLPPPLRAPSLPLDVGRTERVVPPHIRKALNLRDGGCIFDGCQLPVSWCHAHHRVHWADGGPTAVWNLVLLCPRHHVFAHEKHWQIITTTSGRFRVVPPDAESAGISPALAS